MSHTDTNIYSLSVQDKSLMTVNRQKSSRLEQYKPDQYQANAWKNANCGADIFKFMCVSNFYIK